MKRERNAFHDKLADVGWLGWGGVSGGLVIKGGESLACNQMWQSSYMDGIVLKFPKKGGGCVVDWLFGIFSVCIDHGEMPQHCWNASVMSLYNGRRDRREYSNYKGTSWVHLASCVEEW